MHQTIDDEVTAPDGVYDISKLVRKLHEIDTAIARARLRYLAARDAGDEVTMTIEEGVLNRRLAERLAVTS